MKNFILFLFLTIHINFTLFADTEPDTANQNLSKQEQKELSDNSSSLQKSDSEIVNEKKIQKRNEKSGKKSSSKHEKKDNEPPLDSFQKEQKLTIKIPELTDRDLFDSSRPLAPRHSTKPKHFPWVNKKKK